jgi:predicted nucleic acid-binding protein
MAGVAVLLDTGPLVAALSRDDRAHTWAREQFQTLEGPFVTCEAVLSEACHLLRRSRGGSNAVLGLLESGAVTIGMDLRKEVRAIRRLHDRYRNLPSSLADVCLVRMSEIYDASVVLTLDSDFHVYRRHGRKVIPVVSPHTSK